MRLVPLFYRLEPLPDAALRDRLLRPPLAPIHRASGGPGPDAPGIPWLTLSAAAVFSPTGGWRRGAGPACETGA